MNVKQLGILAVAIVLAGASFVMMRQQTGNNGQPVAIVPPKPEIKMVKVLVTNRDYAVGDRIVTGSLVWQDIPANANITSFITQDANAKAAEMYVDAVVKVPMFVGEPFILGKIVVAGDKTGVLASLLNPGMRAASVTITPDSAVSGFIVPDSRVDVILTRQIQFPVGNQSVTRTVSSTIFSNVRVLAVDQNTALAKEQKAISGATATLELSPTDAEKLRAADSLGDLSLVLRSFADGNGPTTSNPDAIALAQPSPASTKVAAAPNSPNAPSAPTGSAPNVVKIYRGGQ